MQAEEQHITVHNLKGPCFDVAAFVEERNTQTVQVALVPMAELIASVDPMVLVESAGLEALAGLRVPVELAVGPVAVLAAVATWTGQPTRQKTATTGVYTANNARNPVNSIFDQLVST